MNTDNYIWRTIWTPQSTAPAKHWSQAYKIFIHHGRFV
jgi:hypothetical protein